MTDTVDPVSPAEIDVLRAMNGDGPVLAMPSDRWIEAVNMLVLCGHVNRTWAWYIAAGKRRLDTRHEISDTGRSILEGMK